MNKTSVLFITLLLSCLAISLIYSENQNVAVIDFTGKKISDDEASMITDLFRGQLVEAKIFSVLDRNNMKRILEEQAFQQTGCTDSACAIKIGQLLNMHYIIVGSVMKLGNTYVLSVDMINVETGKIEQSKQASGETIDQMIKACMETARAISGIKSSSDTNPSVNSATPANTAIFVCEKKEIQVRNINFTLVKIPPGSFKMGDNSITGAESHQVTITKNFWIMETEITQELYEAITGDNPSAFLGNNNPVEKVSWHDAVNFCKNLSKASRLNFNLPTEAQWEYACRAGSVSQYYWGDNESDLFKYANFADINCKEIKWSIKNQNDGYEKTAPVKSYAPNSWGLYDMIGNVREWIADACEVKEKNREVFTSTYQNGISDPLSTKGAFRITRGGDFRFFPRDCRSGSRSGFMPDTAYNYIGFRAVLNE